jgi:uncharacterized protein YndB with AHSA1/START domain
VIPATRDTETQDTSAHVTEHMEELAIVSTRTVRATREDVWNAWTNPILLAQWWGPKGFRNTFYEFDLRPGGAWRFIMHAPDGTNFPNESVFVEIAPPERIVFRHLAPVHAFLATAEFAEHGNGTAIRFTCSSLLPPSARDRSDMWCGEMRKTSTALKRF